MTAEEFKVIKEAHSILDRLTDDKTIMGKKDNYSARLAEAEDGLLHLVFFLEDNSEKIFEGN